MHTRRSRILQSIGSACALVGLVAAGFSSGTTAAHLLDTVVPIKSETPGLDTLAKTAIEFLFGVSGAFCHRVSTFTLRYTVGFQQRTDWCAQFIGKNERIPSWTGLSEELEKIRLGLRALFYLDRSANDLIPRARTRASYGRDPFMRISGKPTTYLQFINYVLAVVLAFICLRSMEVDYYACTFIAMAIGTYWRGFVSLVIQAMNGYFGTATTIGKSFQQCRRTWSDRSKSSNPLKNIGNSINAWCSGCNIIKEERRRGQQEWILATSSVLILRYRQ